MYNTLLYARDAQNTFSYVGLVFEQKTPNQFGMSLDRFEKTRFVL